MQQSVRQGWTLLLSLSVFYRVFSQWGGWGGGGGGLCAAGSFRINMFSLSLPAELLLLFTQTVGSS